MNNLMNFILNNKDWMQLLSRAPYNLIIKSDEDYPNVFLFKYNQYDSDMSNIICQEARGIILEIKDNSVKLLCHSFDKFFNYGEPQGQEILKEFDWSNYTWQEKRDGSLMRLWYYDNKGWCISTSGTIDANKAEIQIPSCPWTSFGDMFRHLLDSYNVDLDSLNKNYTYSFEMTSPDNKIVVNYDKDELTLIGVRDNISNTELDPYTNNPFKDIKCAEVYKFDNLDQALGEINKLDNFEGLVLCDSSYRRVKVKTEEYLTLARVTDETGSDRGLLKLILEDKIDDVVGVLPHLQKRVDIIKGFIKGEIENISNLLDSIDYTKERKDIALELKGNRYQGFVFKKLSNPNYDFIADYFTVDNLEKIYKNYKEATMKGSDGDVSL